MNYQNNKNVQQCFDNITHNTNDFYPQNYQKNSLMKLINSLMKH